MTRILLATSLLLYLCCSCAPPPETAPEASATDPPRFPNDRPEEAPYRPRHHFTPASGWMNDPNGLVYLDGEYHLFFQHYPDSNRWGPMHWGHAVSDNLTDWEELPIALYPDSLGYIFSGSAVVDHDNSSGFGRDGEAPLVAIFTHHDRDRVEAEAPHWESQSIAYSRDRGRSWTKYAGNPVLPNPGGERDFRDPKVIHDGRQWVMTLAVRDRIQFYGSPDLRNWSYLSEWGRTEGLHPGGVWECPELFPLAVQGGDPTWFLLISTGRGGANGGSGTMYYPGSWDGRRFQPHDRPDAGRDSVRWLDYGRDNYAAVTFDNTPDAARERTLVGWMSNWVYAQDVPTYTWRSAMTLARRLTAVSTPDGPLLRQQPILPAARGPGRPLNHPAAPGKATTADLSDLPHPGVFALELELDAAAGERDSLVLTLSNAAGEQYRFGYAPGAGPAGRELFSDRRRSGRTDFNEHFAAGPRGGPDVARAFPLQDGRLRLTAVFDRSSAELFWNDGTTALTTLYFPTAPYTTLTIEGAALREGRLTPL